MFWIFCIFLDVLVCFSFLFFVCFFFHFFVVFCNFLDSCLHGFPCCLLFQFYGDNGSFICFYFFSFPWFFCLWVVWLCCVPYQFFLSCFFLVFSFFFGFLEFWSFSFCLAIQAKMVLWVFLAMLATNLRT